MAAPPFFLPLSANALALLLVLPLSAAAQDASSSPDSAPLAVPDADGTIILDGRLDEPAWAHAARITRFYDTWPGDNVPPPVRTVVVLTYDTRFLYIGVWAEDPNPGAVHAAYTDRDNVGSPDDYVGFVLDTRGDGRSGALFRVSPRGVQADGVFNEAQFALGNPDDLTPDYAWDARVAMSDSGWSAELRIPFSSLRYPHRERQAWGLIVHRVYPRDFVHSLFSVRMPRGTNCFLCHEQRLELTAVPAGGSLVAAPYATARADRTPGLADASSALRTGADVKWTPGASTALDATLRPDFSQIESDVTQLGVNTRFALFYPEKRPFFLEGADLFQTPLQAVYTRSITAPDWGVRTTGALGGTAYTALVTRDRGGGSVVLPGAVASSLVPADFVSTAAIARARTAIPGGFIGALATDREVDAAHGGGGGHNRVVGPDLFWNASGADQLGAQLLASDTRVPLRPDLTPAWNGSRFTSGALDVSWHHIERHTEWFADYRDIGAGFRADDGFMPQVGVRLVNAWVNASTYPTGAISWVSPWVRWQRVTDRASGDVVSEYRYAGIQVGGIRNLNVQLRYSDERMVGGPTDVPLSRRYAWLFFDLAPSRWLARVQVVARLGGDVDLANGRAGRGGEVWDSVVVRPTAHLELLGLSDVALLDVPIGGTDRRLFTAAVERLRATYSFTPRAAIRVVVQNVRIRRDPALYVAPTTVTEGSRTVSALFTYRWNWASAAYLGIGDDREVRPSGTLVPGHQQMFFKLQIAR